MRDLGNFMFPPKNGANTEWLSRSGLLSHMGNDPGWPCVSDTLQSGRGQCHPEMVDHYSGVSEVGTRWFGRVGRVVIGVFYTDNGMIVSRDRGWLQHLMNVMVRLFQQYVLAANIARSCSMTCHPGVLRPGMSAEAKALK